MPLNHELYNMLRCRFGTVRIANEGQAMTFGPKTDPATGRRRIDVHQAGEYYLVDCLFCSDTRQRLWINHRFGTPDPYSGWPMTFLANCYNEAHCLRNANNRRRLYDELFALRNRNARPMIITPGRIDTTPPGPVPAPGALAPISQLPPNHPAVQYLVGERRFALDVLDYYGVRFCAQADPRHPQAANRIIIPVYQNGVVVGWQARYVGEPHNKAIPKYLTSPGMEKSKLLYNLDNAKDKPFVVVVEGVTDVWRVGTHAVALLGKTASHAQRQLLCAHWARKPVVLLLDADAREDARSMLHQLAAGGSNLIVPVMLPDAWDPGSMAHDAVWNVITTQTRAVGMQLPAA